MPNFITDPHGQGAVYMMGSVARTLLDGELESRRYSGPPQVCPLWWGISVPLSDGDTMRGFRTSFGWVVEKVVPEVSSKPALEPVAE